MKGGDVFFWDAQGLQGVEEEDVHLVSLVDEDIRWTSRFSRVAMITRGELICTAAGLV